MGLAKAHIMEDEELREIAAEIACRVGVLSRCSNCEEVYDPLDCHDNEAMYKLGNYLITKGDPLTEGFGGDRKRLTDMLQHIHTYYGTECHCQHMIGKD